MSALYVVALARPHPPPPPLPPHRVVKAVHHHRQPEPFNTRTGRLCTRNVVVLLLVVQLVHKQMKGRAVLPWGTKPSTQNRFAAQQVTTLQGRDGFYVGVLYSLFFRHLLYHHHQHPRKWVSEPLFSRFITFEAKRWQLLESLFDCCTLWTSHLCSFSSLCCCVLLWICCRYCCCRFDVQSKWSFVWYVAQAEIDCCRIRTFGSLQ